MADNIVDVNAMYRAGYASSHKPSFQQERNDLVDQVFSWAGKKAVEHYGNVFKELSVVKRKANSATAAINLEIEKVGDELNPEVQAALDTFKKEYDKGARMSKLGITSKRKTKGQEMMDLAMMKMTQLNSHLGTLRLARKKEQDRALLMTGEGGHDDGSIKGYNEGSMAPALEYSSMLASGELLNHITVDHGTGELVLLEEVGTGQFMGPVTQAEDAASVDADNDGVPDTIDSTPGTPGGEEIMETVKTKWQDLEFAPDADDSLQDVQRAVMENQFNTGLGGKNGERDDMLDSFTLDKIRGHVNDASNNAITSYFFGGTLIDGTKSKLPESAPVYQYLLGQGYEPGSEEWQGALESLKTENFNKGSEMRETVSQFMFEKANEFYDNGYNKYLSQQELDEKKKQKSQGGGGGGGGPDRVMIHGSWYYPDQIASNIDDIKSATEGEVIKRNDGLGTFEFDGENWWEITVPLYEGEKEKRRRISQDKVISRQGYGGYGGGSKDVVLSEDEKIAKGNTDAAKSNFGENMKVGDKIKAGDYEPFEGADGNMIDGNVTIVGYNNINGVYQVRDERGQIHDYVPKVDKSYE